MAGRTKYVSSSSNSSFLLVSNDKKCHCYQDLSVIWQVRLVRAAHLS